MRARPLRHRWRQAFPPDLARTLARELCSAYGPEVAADAPPPGIAARLDAWDAGRRIGLELRGRVDGKAIAGTDLTWPTVVAEPAEVDLDCEEHAELASGGARVHVADVAAFWNGSSGDAFTTTLGYLASVVAFLNDATDGEDVDLSACRAARSMWLPVVEDRAGVTVEGAGKQRLEVARAANVVLAFDPRHAEAASGPQAGRVETRFGAPLAPLKAPYANAGRPSVLHLFGLGSEKGTCIAVLKQPGADGKERELATSTGPVLIAPGDFDSARPFAIVLRLTPGTHWAGDRLWVAAAER